MQANTRIDSGPSNQSLIKQWVSSVVAGYSSRVTWPLLSLKLDDQLVLAKVRRWITLLHLWNRTKPLQPH